MCAPAGERVPEDRVSLRREWLAPASLGVNTVGVSDGSNISSEECKAGDVEGVRSKEIPPLPLLHMQEAPTQGEGGLGRNPQESPEILLTVSQLQQQVCELQDVVRSLSTSQALSSRSPRRGEEGSPRQDAPHMVARTASEERLLQMYREHRLQTHGQQADAELDGCASRSPSPLVNHPPVSRSNGPQRAMRGTNEDQSPRRRPMQPLPGPEGMPVCRSSSSTQRVRPQRPVASAEAARLSPWKALCQRFLPLRTGKPSGPLIDRPGVLQKDVALQVRDIICGMFGSLELAAIQAALDLRLCAEEQVDDFILETLRELAGTDQEPSDSLVADAPLSDLQASLPPVKFALPQFEDMLLEVFPVLLSRRTARQLFQFLDTEQTGLVELTHLHELDRICSHRGGSLGSTRRSPSPVSGRPAASSRSPLVRNSSGEIEEKYSAPPRPCRAARERISPKSKNKSVSPERTLGVAGGRPAWDGSKTVSTAPVVNLTANSGVQLEVEQHQAFISMLRPSATGYSDLPGDAAPSSARRIEDRPERSSSRSGYRPPPGERAARRPRSPTAPSRSSTSGAPRSVSPQPSVPVSREVSNGGASKVRWSPPDLSKKGESKAIETERQDQLSQTILSSASARRSPPPKGGVVAATSSLQNLPANRDLTSEEAKRRASSLQSLLAFAAEVQARQGEAPSTGASSCHEDEPQREPPVTPPAPAKVPAMAMALRQEQLMSLKDHARLEENVDASKTSKSQQASPPTPSSAPHRSDLHEQLPKALARGGSFQAPFAYGGEVAVTPPQELSAEPPTRMSSDSNLGNAQVSCGAVVPGAVNAGQQVHGTPPVPVRASSATSPRVRVRPPESERQKKQSTADAIVRTPPMHAAQSSTQARKPSPLWPAPSHGHDLLQRTPKLGQPLGAAYGHSQQRYTQANIAAVASSNISMAPAAALPRMHSAAANFVGGHGRGNCLGQVISRTDYVTSPRPQL